MNKVSKTVKAKQEKYFLDTSVLRPVLLGSKTYRKYFEEQFKNGRRYVSDYVLMEFKRSYLRNVLNFYFMLDMPSIETVGDAFVCWSNKFKSSELKAILQFVGQLADTFKFNVSDPKDKQKILRQIGLYVKRVEIKSRKVFKNIGKNETDCHRAKVPFQSQSDSNMTEMFRNFLQEFNDKTACRSKCSIATFFLNRYQDQVKDFIKYADKLPNPGKTENKGFIKIISKLKETQGEKDFSCHLCEAIGDAVIVLESPRDIRLEHTDYSFDHLCPIINQPHYKHPSETSILKNLSEDSYER